MEDAFVVVAIARSLGREYHQASDDVEKPTTSGCSSLITQRDDLLEERARVKDTRLQTHQLPSDAAAFSGFQFERLLHRSSLNRRLDHMNRVIGHQQAAAHGLFKSGGDSGAESPQLTHLYTSGARATKSRRQRQQQQFLLGQSRIIIMIATNKK